MRFTPGELECMKILWEFGEQKPSEIQERMSRSLKNPAVRSYLSILVEKGYVSRRKVGKAYYYKAKTHRDRAFRGMMRELVATFCGGSTRRLMAFLIKNENLSAAELEELARAAEEDPEDDKRPKRGVR
ncbi:MAG: BlaI/MecI/CopY family transcriptional regulator [Candidatus Hydrogenedentales bacterium]|jgi:predicted transcriptional regulator